MTDSFKYLFQVYYTIDFYLTFLVDFMKFSSYSRNVVELMNLRGASFWLRVVKWQWLTLNWSASARSFWTQISWVGSLQVPIGSCRQLDFLAREWGYMQILRAGPWLQPWQYSALWFYLASSLSPLAEGAGCPYLVMSVWLRWTPCKSASYLGWLCHQRQTGYWDKESQSRGPGLVT